MPPSAALSVRTTEDAPPRRRGLALAGLLVMVALLALVDYSTGTEISFSIFYLVPVGAGAWFLGLGPGLALSLVACILWGLNDSVLGGHQYSHWAIPAWNALMRGLIFATTATLAARMHETLRREQRANARLVHAYEALDEARKEQLVVKDRLLSHVSHELRTPLTALHQFLTILDDGLAGDLRPEQHEYLRIALRNAEQLKRMIADLLESSRADADKLEIRSAPMDVRPLVDDIVRTLRSPAAEAGIDVQVEATDELPEVLADAARVRQVLLNLLDNALKFTAGPGRILVRARTGPELPGFLAISVSDTGRGISADALDSVFSRLYQVEDKDGASRKGLGLGLHICREIVQRHGGRIWAESAVGEGSTFTFTLPLAAPEAARS